MTKIKGKPGRKEKQEDVGNRKRNEARERKKGIDGKDRQGIEEIEIEINGAST